MANNYNCCQAIVCAYCEELGLSEDVAFKLTEGEYVIAEAEIDKDIYNILVYITQLLDWKLYSRLYIDN